MGHARDLREVVTRDPDLAWTWSRIDGAKGSRTGHAWSREGLVTGRQSLRLEMRDPLTQVAGSRTSEKGSR